MRPDSDSARALQLAEILPLESETVEQVPLSVEHEHSMVARVADENLSRCADRHAQSANAHCQCTKWSGCAGCIGACICGAEHLACNMTQGDAHGAWRSARSPPLSPKYS
eukprot:2439743-Rhodomonas_salina.4